MGEVRKETRASLLGTMRVVVESTQRSKAAERLRATARESLPLLLKITPACLCTAILRPQEHEFSLLSWVTFSQPHVAHGWFKEVVIDTCSTGPRGFFRDVAICLRE